MLDVRHISCRIIPDDPLPPQCGKKERTEMKKLLGWAVVAMLVGMGVYYGLLEIGALSYLAALTSVIIVVALTISPFDASYSWIVALFGTLLIVGVGFVMWGTFVATILVALSVSGVAIAVADKIGASYWSALIVYWVEGAGIYGSLKLGLWWPAAIAALILGVWWLAVRLAEMRPAVSI